ncbi:hypothetical protein NX021_23395 [Cytobacillus firmus]|nr:hypothetical protein [Cytobacillus firmus]
MILDINRTKAKINIKLTKTGVHSVKNILKFKQLIETSNEENKPTIALKILETDNNIFSGPNWNFNTPDSSDPDDFKIFLEKLLYIEHHFNKEFTFPTNISQRERRIVDLVYHSLKDGELKVPFNQTYYFHLDKKQDIYKLLKLHDENNEVLNIGLDLHSTDKLNLFGLEFKYVSNRVFLENVKLKKPNILQSKYELFEDGDSIRIELIPIEPHSYISEKLLLEVLA